MPRGVNLPILQQRLGERDLKPGLQAWIETADRVDRDNGLGFGFRSAGIRS